MRITRVIANPSGNILPPGTIIEKEFRPDGTIVQETPGEILFRNADGETVLRQTGWKLKPRKIVRYVIDGTAEVERRLTVDGERTFVKNASERETGSCWSGTVSFAIRADEHILGLGQHEDGVTDYRNCTVYLYQNNMQIPMPVFLSTAGYAVLFDAGCLMVYEERDNVITVTLDAAEQIAYYVLTDADPKALVAGIRRITGKAALLPLWAYGYIQSKERYRDAGELEAVAAEFEKRRIPVSCLVQDWLTWGPGKWGDKHLDLTRYPDFKRTVDSLHGKGIALMFSVWPNMNFGGADNEEMLRAGKLYANLSTYDAFDPEARALYWKQCEREIFAAGTDAWWCDSSEPFTPDWNGPEKLSDQARYEMTKAEDTRYMDAREANLYAVAHAKGIYENQLAADHSRRVVNLTRSGNLSVQKYGAVLWSGDIAADWETLRNQVAEGLQMAASGIPWWTLDIGAFFAGDGVAQRLGSPAPEGKPPWFWHGNYPRGVEDRGYRELYTRWLQYGTFLPLMRSHGTDTPREPWNFGEEGDVWYDTIVRYIRLRYHLIPCIYSLAGKVSKEDAMLMRALYFDYPGDARVWDADSEYLFGDFLAAPVTFPVEFGPEDTPVQAKAERAVYLPAGDDWYEYDTGIFHRGGQTVTAAAPVERMPLYVRAGSLVPVDGRPFEWSASVCGADFKGAALHVPEGTGKLAPGSEAVRNLYEKQKPESQGLEIFAGRDGSFTWYLDAGNGYGFENGEFASVRLSWNDPTKTLSFSRREGSYPVPEIWHIAVLSEGGILMSRTVRYSGEPLEVRADS